MKLKCNSVRVIDKKMSICTNPAKFIVYSKGLRYIRCEDCKVNLCNKLHDLNIPRKIEKIHGA